MSFSLGLIYPLKSFTLSYEQLKKPKCYVEMYHVWLIYTLLSTDSLIVGLPLSIRLIHPLKVSPRVHFVPCQGNAEHQVWHICQLFCRKSGTINLTRDEIYLYNYWKNQPYLHPSFWDLKSWTTWFALYDILSNLVDQMCSLSSSHKGYKIKHGFLSPWQLLTQAV